MTREDAIKIFNTVLVLGKCDCAKEEAYECLEMAIKALEQKPCDDAISRQEVLNNAYAYGNGLEPDGYCVNVEDIQALPPVTPQPRSEVLDKIRTEIENLTYYWCEVNPKNVIDDVLEIIDKYKAESEGYRH